MITAAEKLEIEGLRNTVANHRRLKQENAPAYLHALRKLELRRGRGLDLEKTKECVITAAHAGRFVSYKDIADASGLEMSKAHLVLPSHLGTLCDYAHAAGLPLLSAIVVNVDGVEKGKMNAKSQAGFIKAAKSLNKVILNEDAFVREEQERVFARFAERSSA